MGARREPRTERALHGEPVRVGNSSAPVRPSLHTATGMLELQRLIGNRAVSALLASFRAPEPTVQRAIHVKGGARYNNRAELRNSKALDNVPNSSGGGVQNIPGWADLAGRADDSHAYLVRSLNDLTKRFRGEAAPMLSPHRHLIGEDHRASRFDEAANDWGWGAVRLSEGLQTSASVKHSISEELITTRGFLATNWLYGARPLEDMHAKTLAELAVCRVVIEEMGQLLASVKTRYTAGQSLDQQDQKFHRHQEWRVGQIEELESLMQDYQQAAVRFKPSNHPTAAELAMDRFAQDMRNDWKPLFLSMRRVKQDPWGILSYLPGVFTSRLTEGIDAATELVRLIDVIAPRVTSLLDAEDASKTNLAQTSWTAATARGGDPLTNMGAIREEFMIANINAPPVPVIVALGADHVPRISGRVTDVKGYANFRDFEAELLR